MAQIIVPLFCYCHSFDKQHFSLNVLFCLRLKFENTTECLFSLSFVTIKIIMIQMARILSIIKHGKILLLFTLHALLDIRQHFRENNHERTKNEREREEKKKVLLHTNWFIQLLKSTSSYNDRQ